MSAWSTTRSACESCGTAATPHHARGLCRTCYKAQPDQRATHGAAKRRRRSTPEGKAFEHEQYMQRREAQIARILNRYHSDPEYRATMNERSRAWMSAHRAERADGLYRRPRTYWRNRHQLIHVEGRGCEECGSRENLETHHIVPESEGGGHEIDNLAVLCAEHHRGPLGVHGSKVLQLTQ